MNEQKKKKRKHLVWFIMRKKTEHLLCVFFFFQRGSRHVAQAGLELVILLPQPPKCWNYRCVPPHSASEHLFCVCGVILRAFCLLGRHSTS
jgi:hypothetical protein